MNGKWLGFAKLERPDLAKPRGFCTGHFSQTSALQGQNEIALCKSREVLPRKTRFVRHCKSAKTRLRRIGFQPVSDASDRLEAYPTGILGVAHKG